jgi:hypothetical protein
MEGIVTPHAKLPHLADILPLNTQLLKKNTWTPYQKQTLLKSYTGAGSEKPVETHAEPRTTLPTANIVRIQAPALPPFVMGDKSMVTPALAFDPALLSPVLEPPLWFVNGGNTPWSVYMVDTTTDMALISCPHPDVPSYIPVDHWKPQVRPFDPPVHWDTAALADACRYGIIVSLVYGAS